MFFFNFSSIERSNLRRSCFINKIIVLKSDSKHFNPSLLHKENNKHFQKLIKFKIQNNEHHSNNNETAGDKTTQFA